MNIFTPYIQMLNWNNTTVLSLIVYAMNEGSNSVVWLHMGV